MLRETSFSCSMDTDTINENLVSIYGDNINMFNLKSSSSQNSNEEMMELNLSTNELCKNPESVTPIDPTMKKMKIRKMETEFQPAKKPLRTYIAKNIARSMTDTQAVTTNNMFQVLTTATSTSTQSKISEAKTGSTTCTTDHNVIPRMSTTLNSNKTDKPKVKKPPPIILVSKINYFELRKQIKKLTTEDITAQYCPQGIKIFASNDDDYNKIGYYLKTQSYDFYTFPHGQPKMHKVVLKGLPIDTATEDIQGELVSLHFAVESVKQMKRKQIDEESNKLFLVPMPVWIITTHVTQTAPDIHTLTGLFGLKLKIEDYRGKEGPLQCYKCQGFGHKAISCFVKPKCVKCANEHLTKDCNSENTLIPKCANCKEEHTANYKQCPKYVKYVQGIRRNREQSRNTNFTLNQQDFPTLPMRNSPIMNTTSRNNSENITSIFQDLRELWGFFKNINIYINKFKSIMYKIRQEQNTVSKIGTLLEGITEMFDSETEHGHNI